MNTSIEQACALIQRRTASSRSPERVSAPKPAFPISAARVDCGRIRNLMELMSAVGFRRDPAAFYRASLQTLPNIHRAEPTTAHHLVARLEAQGKLSAVVTQNIDGLHQAAGSQTVYEIHGNFRTGSCVDCRGAYEMAAFYDRIERGEIELPLCPALPFADQTRCRAVRRPAAVRRLGSRRRCFPPLRPDAGSWLVTGRLPGG